MGCVEQVGRTSLDVCQAQREDYMECLHNTKLGTRLEAIEQQRAKLIREGKWPPPPSSS